MLKFMPMNTKFIGSVENKCDFCLSNSLYCYSRLEKSIDENQICWFSFICLFFKFQFTCHC